MTSDAVNLRTNRDFHVFVCGLVERYQAADVPLETYLRALRQLVRARHFGETLPLAEVARVLAEAFEAHAGDEPIEATDAGEGQRRWEARLAAQLDDLRALRERHVLTDERAYFGLTAPSGTCWYNLEPCQYLEAAAEAVAPEALDRPVSDLSSLSWDQFTDFLECGAVYE
jgi:hypothetical protein